MTKINKIIYFIITVIFLVVSNLYFSNIIVNDLCYQPIDNPILELVCVKNSGAAFNIFENYRAFLTAFAIFAVIFIVTCIVKNISKISLITVFFSSVLLSGVLCNLFERIFYGYVRDFFLLKFIEFPIFNISDVFINISVFALVIIIIKNRYIKNDKTNS